MNKILLKKCLFFLCCFSFTTAISQADLRQIDKLKIIAHDSVQLKKDTLQIKEKVVVTEPDTVSFEMLFPQDENWNFINEGETLNFQIKTKGPCEGIRFTVLNENDTEIKLDSSGYFSWTPAFDFVDRLEEYKTVQVIFKALTSAEEKAARQVEFIVKHVNRPPQLGELKNFYVQYNALNSYQIDGFAVKDEDNDPLVFKPVLAKMPEGAKLSETGLFTWQPSHSQFYEIKATPLVVPFIVEDQPYKARANGFLTISATQMDLPPEVSIVPKISVIRSKEDETINLKFFLSDPNGDENISGFDFITDDIRIPKTALVRNSLTNYEFIWTPGYNFVRDNQDSVSVDFTFFVMDKSKNREERKIRIVVEDSEDIVAKEKLVYNQYRAGLVRVWDLIEQLQDKERELKKDLKVARKGKRHRALINASVGGITGLSPVLINEKDPQRAITAVGGTTTLTMGTLDATEMIGKSPDKLLERLNYVLEKKNELQIQGDIFARKYSLPLARRGESFKNDLDKLLSLLTIKNVASLELDATWRNKKKISDENIKTTFNDFNPFNE